MKRRIRVEIALEASDPGKDWDESILNTLETEMELRFGSVFQGITRVTNATDS